MERLTRTLSDLWQDLHYTFRLLRKNPGFMLVAVLSLAIGIGPNIAMFSVVNMLLLKPIPVDQPHQLVSLHTIDVKNPSRLQLSYPNYLDFKENLKPVFSDIFVHTPAFLSMNDGERSEKIFSAAVSDNYFNLLGVKAAFGRTFLPDESDKPVVVLSHAFWSRRFGADIHAIGKTLRLNRNAFTIIGVAPKEFTGTEIGSGPDLWLPLLTFAEITPGVSDWCKNRRFLFLNSTARLQTGATVQQAQSAVTTLSNTLAQQYPNDNTGRTVKLTPLIQARIDPDNKGTYSLVSLVLMVLVSIILLIACINVASLLLVRAKVRQSEVAIRIAIGANRWRLIRQLMTESIMLALIGGATGLGLAFLCKDLLWTLRPTAIFTEGITISIDRRPLMLALLLSIMSGIIFGLAPALYASKPGFVSTLKGALTERTRIGSTFRLQKILIVVQVALCLISLIGAGLFLKSFYNARAINTGYNVDNILLASLNMGFEGYDETRGKQFYEQLVSRIEALPGVKGAVLARGRPFKEPYRRTVFIEDDTTSGGKGTLVATNQVGLHYFQTLGIDLLQGRDFNQSDGENTQPIAIINEAMAQRFWPGQTATGQRFKLFGEETAREIIGVVRNTNINSVGEDPQPCLYLFLRQDYSPSVTLFVRAANDPGAIFSAIQNETRQLDSNLLLYDVETFRDLLSKSLWATKAGAGILTGLGLMALLLAAVGLFGVMSFFIFQRRREIGIRMALGADRRDVLKLVFQEGMLLVIGGIVVGIGASLAMTRLVTGLLFGVTPLDPGTFIIAPLVLAIVAIIAILIPARKATRIDPLIALRTE